MMWLHRENSVVAEMAILGAKLLTCTSAPFSGWSISVTVPCVPSVQALKTLTSLCGCITVHARPFLCTLVQLNKYTSFQIIQGVASFVHKHLYISIGACLFTLHYGLYLVSRLDIFTKELNHPILIQKVKYTTFYRKAFSHTGGYFLSKVASKNKGSLDEKIIDELHRLKRKYKQKIWFDVMIS